MDDITEKSKGLAWAEKQVQLAQESGNEQRIIAAQDNLNYVKGQIADAQKALRDYESALASNKGIKTSGSVGGDGLGLKDLSGGGKKAKMIPGKDATGPYTDYLAEQQGIYDDARTAALKNAKDEEKDLNKALQLQGDLKIRAAKKTGKDKILLLEKDYKTELALLQRNGLSTVELEKQYSEERTRIAKEEMEQKISFVTNLAQNDLAMLSKTLEGHKGTAIARKRIAQGEALVSGAQGVMGVLANTDEYLKWLGPVAGPIAEGVELGLIAAMTVSQLGVIERSKMAYGGVVTGGTPGVDSVPAMLMPGEVVFNPALPDSRLASQFGNHTANIGGTTIVVQGNVSKSSINQIGQVTEKALISALRKAQYMGKITARDLKVRN